MKLFRTDFKFNFKLSCNYLLQQTLDGSVESETLLNTTIPSQANVTMQDGECGGLEGKTVDWSDRKLVQTNLQKIPESKDSNQTQIYFHVLGIGLNCRWSLLPELVSYFRQRR